MKQVDQTALEFPSLPNNISLVAPLVSKIAKECRIGEEKKGVMLLALTEAVTNAIYHGNRMKAAKKVRVYTSRNVGAVSFVVEDEGLGFDPDVVPDPTAPENLCKEGGRGVYLIRQICDRVVYRNAGRTVEMQFNLTR
jgi:serine/threonine-protein kinase RsbW